MLSVLIFLSITLLLIVPITVSLSIINPDAILIKVGDYSLTRNDVIIIFSLAAGSISFASLIMTVIAELKRWRGWI